MSAKENGDGLGCGGILFIILALFVVLGLAGLGSDTSSWDCPGEQTPCSQGK